MVEAKLIGKGPDVPGWKPNVWWGVSWGADSLKGDGGEVAKVPAKKAQGG